MSALYRTGRRVDKSGYADAPEAVVDEPARAAYPRTMRRVSWVLGLVVLLVLAFVGGSRADESGSNPWDPAREIRICARPPKAEAAGVFVWAVSDNGTIITGDPALFFSKVRKGARIYVYDPQAPPSSGARLGLTCPPRYQPNTVPSAVTDALLKEDAAKKEEARKKDEARKKEAKANKHKQAEKARADREKDEAAKREAQARVERARQGAQQQAHRPEPPPSGAIAVEEPASEQPTATTAVPSASRPAEAAPMAAVCVECTPKDPTKKPGKEKTKAETLADEMAHAAAILQLRMNEEKPEGGKQYGIIGGKNPDGFNNPIAQTIAAGVIITLETLTAAGKFEKFLMAALKTSRRIVIKATTPVCEAAAEALSKKYGLAFADALRANGMIAPYRLMRKFTAGLGGQLQAHHILEASMAGKFGLGDPDLMPSVILTDEMHKAITAKLAKHPIKPKDVKELWDKYQTVYQDFPEWLDSIKSYFKK